MHFSILHLSFPNHFQPQGIRIGLEHCAGLRRKNEPCAPFHFLPQLILTPSGVAQINMKNVRLRSGRNGLFEEGLRGDQINAIEDVLCPFEFGRRLEQRKHRRRFEWPSEIDRVGKIFRRLQILKHTRKRDIRAAVENEPEYALRV